MHSRMIKPASNTPMKPLAWSALLFNVLVIVWGAYVRASGSGAGCGSHWPLCNGQLIPHTGLLTTSIEFAHRITSGICLILAVAIAWVGVRHFARGSAVRKSAIAVLGFTLMEAVIGAGLVLFGYTAHDQSLGRVISISLHLSNTFLLLASLTLTAWWSTSPPKPLQITKSKEHARIKHTAMLALFLTGLLGMTGAITALGDTLFQATSLTQGFQRDFATASHFLVKLRVIHPFLAVLTATFLFHYAELASQVRGRGANDSDVARFSTALRALVGTQLALGALNLVLLAPTPLQLVHLLVAESLWIVLVLLTAVTLWEQDLPQQAHVPTRKEELKAPSHAYV
jgi:heme A synthase